MPRRFSKRAKLSKLDHLFIIVFLSVKLGSGEVIEKRPGGVERYFRNYGVEEIRDIISRYFRVLDVYTHSDKEGETWISVFGSKTDL